MHSFILRRPFFVFFSDGITHALFGIDFEGMNNANNNGRFLCSYRHGVDFIFFYRGRRSHCGHFGWPVGRSIQSPFYYC